MQHIKTFALVDSLPGDTSCYHESWFNRDGYLEKEYYHHFAPMRETMISYTYSAPGVLREVRLTTPDGRVSMRSYCSIGHTLYILENRVVPQPAKDTVYSYTRSCIMIFDAQHRLIEKTDINIFGNATDYTYSYDDRKHCITRCSNRAIGEEKICINHTYYYFDRNNKQLLRYTSTASGSKKEECFTYNAEGNIESVLYSELPDHCSITYTYDTYNNIVTRDVRDCYAPKTLFHYRSVISYY